MTVKFDIASSRVTRLKQIRIDETDLTYAEQGNGEPIIFIHGALGDYRTWSHNLTGSLGGTMPSHTAGDFTGQMHRAMTPSVIHIADTSMISLRY